MASRKKFIQFIFSWTNKKGRIDSKYEFGINSAFNFKSFDILDDHYRFVEKNHKSPSNTTTTVLSTSVVWILMPPISDWHHEKSGLFFFSWTNKKGRIDSNYDFWNQLCLWFNFSKFRHSLKKITSPRARRPLPFRWKKLQVPGSRRARRPPRTWSKKNTSPRQPSRKTTTTDLAK